MASKNCLDEYRGFLSSLQEVFSRTFHFSPSRYRSEEEKPEKRAEVRIGEASLPVYSNPTTASAGSEAHVCFPDPFLYH